MESKHPSLTSPLVRSHLCCSASAKLCSRLASNSTQIRSNQSQKSQRKKSKMLINQARQLSLFKSFSSLLQSKSNKINKTRWN